MYAERPPCPALADRVACVWLRTASADHVQLVVPDACVDLVWGPDGLFVAGPDTGPMPVRVRAGDVLHGVRFRPGAAGDLFGVPLHELRDLRVSASELPGLARLRITERPGPRLRAMCSALASRPHTADPAAPAVAAALRGSRTVAEAAGRLGLGERQLHRRTVAAFGYAPKTLQRIVRFQRALSMARAGVPLAEVAARAGYADQAHLANDVRRLSGVPMGELVSPLPRLP
ncbi:DUF6597 domain-containing transcriptional factor [Nonomuraea pusilla]|uniref:DUF6597 domain-containing transcriptional factor n=1 Tax=Nonomuraea pusilla TaxID=46177 RepID=UPI003333470A